MKGDMRNKVQAELDSLEAQNGEGGATMLCNLETRLILARSQGAPVTQGRADEMARMAFSATSDPVTVALFSIAGAEGQPAMARKLTDKAGCIGVIRSAECEEGIVLSAELWPIPASF